MDGMIFIKPRKWSQFTFGGFHRLGPWRPNCGPWKIVTWHPRTEALGSRTNPLSPARTSPICITMVRMAVISMAEISDLAVMCTLIHSHLLELLTGFPNLSAFSWHQLHDRKVNVLTHKVTLTRQRFLPNGGTLLKPALGYPVSPVHWIQWSSSFTLSIRFISSE